MTDLHFWLFLLVGGSAVAAAVGMLLLRNAVYSALCLIYIMGALALLFLMLDAPFLALVQVTVYAGAVMVLFLFVMMLLGNQAISAGEREIRGLPIIASIGATIFILAAGLAIQSGEIDKRPTPPSAPQLRVAQYSLAETAAEGAQLWIGGIEKDLDFGYGAASEFHTLPPGRHIVTLVGADGSRLYEGDVSLEDGALASWLIYPGADGELTAARVSEDGSHVGLRESRLTLVNLSGAPLTVYDTGSDRSLDTARDPLWEAELASGAASEARLTERGRIDLAFVNGATGETLLRTPDLELVGGESALLVIAADATGRTIWHHHSEATPDPFGSPAAVGQSLFRRYLLPFEMIGVLLLAALVGGIIIAQGQRREVRRRDVRRRVARTLGAAIEAQSDASDASDASEAAGAAQLPIRAGAASTGAASTSAAGDGD